MYVWVNVPEPLPHVEKPKNCIRVNVEGAISTVISLGSRWGRQCLRLFRICLFPAISSFPDQHFLACSSFRITDLDSGRKPRGILA
jgi:hypothetical protein